MSDDQTDRTIAVRCACGWEVRDSEDAVVIATQEHGRRLHNMSPSRKEVLAMVLDPVEDTG